MIYLISDTHFNHKNIIRYCNRPFKDVDEMNHALIHAWNIVVKPEDTIYHLGDVGLTNEAQLKAIITQLNGHKILIKGNHDTKSNQFFLDCGFESVSHTAWITIDGLFIYLSHCPESRPGDGKPYDLHFYGHIHDKLAAECPTIARNGACLCVERWDYKPVALDEVVKLCRTAPLTSSII